MEAGEEEFVKRRIYLTLERGRDIILRNIFRKVFLAGGFEATTKDGVAGGEGTGSGSGTPSAGGAGTAGGSATVRRTRVPVKEFAAALQIAGAEVGDGEGGIDGDEVECLIANAIYKVSQSPAIHRTCTARKTLPAFTPARQSALQLPEVEVAAYLGRQRR